ncbi:MAG TPA: CoA transferase [Hyphomicrobiaceae bacterium]|nr:CoA transferase [Hyphomicrobiaceae bacterium]
MTEPSHTPKPLKKLCVLDLSQGIAGPYCGGLFAEYGARVIKVEPPAGDWMRPLGPGRGGNSASFLYYNRGKHSLALDLKAKGATDIVLELASRSDVVIENNRPGISDRLGFGFDAVRARQPRVIYVSVSGLGQTGPDANLPLTDTVAQARSGLMSVNRGRADIPAKIDTTIIDATTGLYAFQAATMALWGDPLQREARHLDISLLQSAAAIQGPKVMEYGILGAMPQKLNAPAGSFASADGYLAISLVREADWHAVCRVIGREDYITDPNLGSFALRAPHNHELTEAVEAVFRTASTAHWIERLQGAGVLVARINDYGDWMEDGQTAATNGAPVLPVTASDSAPVVRTPGQVPNGMLCPKIGEHSRAILSEAGLGNEAIEELIQSGAVKDTG